MRRSGVYLKLKLNLHVNSGQFEELGTDFFSYWHLNRARRSIGALQSQLHEYSRSPRLPC